MGYLCLDSGFVCFIAVVAVSFWDSWHRQGLELCQRVLHPRGKLGGTWPQPHLPSAFLLPLKSLQSLTLAELLGLPLVLQLEDVTIPLSQKTFVPLPLGAESGGSSEMGLTWVPCAPCWAPPEAGMLQDRLKGGSSLHGPVALGCTRFFKRLVSGA